MQLSGASFAPTFPLGVSHRALSNVIEVWDLHSHYGSDYYFLYFGGKKLPTKKTNKQTGKAAVEIQTNHAIFRIPLSSSQLEAVSQSSGSSSPPPPLPAGEDERKLKYLY